MSAEAHRWYMSSASQELLKVMPLVAERVPIRGRVTAPESFLAFSSDFAPFLLGFPLHCCEDRRRHYGQFAPRLLERITAQTVQVKNSHLLVTSGAT